MSYPANQAGPQEIFAFFCKWKRQKTLFVRSESTTMTYIIWSYGSWNKINEVFAFTLSKKFIALFFWSLAGLSLLGVVTHCNSLTNSSIPGSDWVLISTDFEQTLSTCVDVLSAAANYGNSRKFKGGNWNSNPEVYNWRGNIEWNTHWIPVLALSFAGEDLGLLSLESFIESKLKRSVA